MILLTSTLHLIKVAALNNNKNKSPLPEKKTRVSILARLRIEKNVKITLQLNHTKIKCVAEIYF